MMHVIDYNNSINVFVAIIVIVQRIEPGTPEGTVQDELNIDDPMTIRDTVINDAVGLMSAVSRAVGRPLEQDVMDDIVTVQVGCNILNHWGCAPAFVYSKCYYCPHSEDLDREFVRAGTVTGEEPTEVPPESMEALKDIFSKGDRYAVAYATMLSAIDINPGWSLEDVMGIVYEVDPDLRDVLDDMVSSLRR